VTKNFVSDLVDANISATYAYRKSTVLDATSSQNSSQWNNIETVNGSNAIGRISRSDFDQGHRVLSNSSVKFKWSDNMKTTIGLFTKELKDHRLVMFIMIEETCCKTRIVLQH
jgi:hypothetical protein